MFSLVRVTRSLSLFKLVLASLLMLSLPCQGETIQQRMPNGLLASAEYLESANDESPILILHGFLQTRDFFTVRRIADALHDDGHTVLLPNLSLGIEQRSQSLACEAIHSHNMELDRDEVAIWVNWLSQRTSKPVTLIGHSIGSLTLLAYLHANSPNNNIKQSILVSLIAFAQGPIAKENSAEKKRAEKDLDVDKHGIHNYKLAFCDIYPTRPDHYLSYLRWDQTLVTEALLGLSKKPSIILGSKDNRLSPEWKPLLNQIKANVVEIEDANHFFDHAHEFDLFEAIIELL
ncbi:MAG: alpha/beta fold hydrolase [Candidatus Thiodiazotropha sp. 6PLUC9]